MKSNSSKSMKNIYLLNKFIYLSVICLIQVFYSSTLLLAQSFPSGFSQVKVGTVYYPTSMAVAPDGRIFVTEKAGKVKVVKNGAILSKPFLQVTVDQMNERGLGGIAFDPEFGNNNYVYIYYTTASHPIHNRLSRFTADGDVSVPGSEVIIHDFDPSLNSIHNGGGMEFGPDGKLYLAIGNDNVNSNSQDLSKYQGKVLRINKDFSVPSGNPFTSGSEAQKRIWAYGLRNPWSIAFQPGTGKLYTIDVGEGSWEEINDASSGGRNFGWPNSEGYTNDPGITSPVYAYSHWANGNDGGCAITGGVFFNPSSTNYPNSYIGKYFFIDYCNKWINYLDEDNKKHNFASSMQGSLNYIKTGKDGNLYYFNISNDALYKIIYSNGDAPVITSDPTSVTVSEGETASFNVSASGSQLNYQWRKNGNDISGANSSGYSINSVQQSDSGLYSVIVSNGYGKDTSKSAKLTVTTYNARPVATIINPSNNSIYRAGDTIYFTGEGSDPEDGTLADNSFSWTVVFHHDDHTHPGPSAPQGVKTGYFHIPPTGEFSANVYYRLYLIVTDSKGLTDTSWVKVIPKTSTIYLKTQPAGLKVLLDGQPHTSPYSVLAVSGMPRDLDVKLQQSMNGSDYEFSHWIHGGDPSQVFTVDDNDVFFEAVFNLNGSTSIQKFYDKEWFQLFPNPAKEDIYLTFSSNKSIEKNTITVKIININGQILYENEHKILKESFGTLIKLDKTLPEGLYVIQVLSGTESEHKLFSIIK